MDDSLRWQKYQYEGLSREDARLKIEARLLDILSKYGGKRIVAGKNLHDLVQDVTNEILSMKEDGLL